MGAPDEADLWAHPVFSVGDAAYSWADVACFARRGDAWERLRREIRDGLACRRAGHTPDPADVDRAARAFRYQRRLITAEETEAWLARRGLDVAQWMDHVRREVLRAASPGPVDSHDVADDEVDALAWVHGWCAGHFERLSLEVAQRAAARQRLGGELDDALDRFRAAVVTDEAVADLVARRGLDWLRVELEEAVFPSEGAAREAVLSVRFDGLALAEVCALAGAPAPAVRAHRLERLDDAFRAAVLGAAEGDLAGPVQAVDGYVVAKVLSKTPPSVEDPDVARRAADAVLATALRHEVDQRVRWHEL